MDFLLPGIATGLICHWPKLQLSQGWCLFWHWCCEPSADRFPEEAQRRSAEGLCNFCSSEELSLTWSGDPVYLPKRKKRESGLVGEKNVWKSEGRKKEGKKWKVRYSEIKINTMGCARFCHWYPLASLSGPAISFHTQLRIYKNKSLYFHTS